MVSKVRNQVLRRKKVIFMSSANQRGLWLIYGLIYTENNKQHVCLLKPRQVVLPIQLNIAAVLLVLEIWWSEHRNPQEMIPELQVEINSPPHLPPLYLPFLYSRFPLPLSVFYSHLLFSAPLLLLFLFPCFTQMFSWIQEGLIGFWLTLTLYQHSSLHSLFCRTILKTICSLCCGFVHFV